MKRMDGGNILGNDGMRVKKILFTVLFVIGIGVNGVRSQWTQINIGQTAALKNIQFVKRL